MFFAYIWVFPKIVGFHPKSSISFRVFHYKPSILGYPYFWKHPYGDYLLFIILFFFGGGVTVVRGG